MPGRWRSRRTLVEPCNATELMLRSGRTGALVRPPERVEGPDAVVEEGLGELARRLGVALVALGPHRDSADEGLRRAYRAIHDAMGDLGAILLRVRASRPAGPARPARRRRPWGARS